MSKEITDPKQKQYSKIGIIIVVIFVMLVILLNLGKENLPWKYYSIYIEIPLIGKLKEGSAIFNQGSQIGYIKEIEITDEVFILHSKIKRKMRLPRASYGQILQDDYKKQDFLDIGIRDGKSMLLMDGDTIRY